MRQECETVYEWAVGQLLILHSLTTYFEMRVGVEYYLIYLLRSFGLI
jgi:hypothetical protein